MDQAGSIQLDVPDFSNSVLSHLNQLRMQGRLCDIVVNVQGQSFRAHKVVLAASSPYFRDHMSLGDMSTVSLSVIRNPSVFEQLLSFCYTGRLCLQLADIISYLTAASFLQMQHIIDRCTQILEGIHFRINLADVENEVAETQRGSRQRTASGGGPGSSSGLQSPGLSSPKGSARLCGIGSTGGLEARGIRDNQDMSPAGESMSPQVVEHESDAAVSEARRVRENEPVLRINRAGQWYMESGLEDSSGEETGVRVTEGLQIKTERLDDWGGMEAHASATEVSGTEKGDASMVIDASRRSSLVQEEFVTGAMGSKPSQPSSSFSETERFSPAGSVVVTMGENERPKSESPGRVYEPKHSTAQGEESTAVYEVGGYEDYLRDQVGDRWFRYNPRLTCIYCCKSFNQKGSLDRHMRLHMGITPFVCRICGKKYTRKDQLEYHIRKHTGNKPFHCHLCAKSFPFQAILNQHLRKNHPGSSQQDPSHSGSPETTSTTPTVSSRGGQGDAEAEGGEASPDQDKVDGAGGGGASSTIGEGMQTSVSTTGPD